MEKWLDTKTKELLQKIPTEKLAPPGTEGFSVVLLKAGNNLRRITTIVRQLTNSQDIEESNLEKHLPLIVKKELTYEDALLLQFDFICYDSVSIFVNDTIVKYGGRNYLASLFDKVMKSPEFAVKKIKIIKLPDNETGIKFAMQFLGLRESEASFYVKNLSNADVQICWKKARIMMHWVEKIGGEIEIVSEEI